MVFSTEETHFFWVLNVYFSNFCKHIHIFLDILNYDYDKMSVQILYDIYHRCVSIVYDNIEMK